MIKKMICTAILVAMSGCMMACTDTDSKGKNTDSGVTAPVDSKSPYYNQLLLARNSYDDTNAIIKNGQVLVRGYTYLLRDDFQNETIGYVVNHMSEQETYYTIYDVDGNVKYDCHTKKPLLVVEPWLFLQDSANWESLMEIVNMETGEESEYSKQYRYATTNGNGYILLTNYSDSINHPPLLLNHDLNFVKQFDGIEDSYFLQDGEKNVCILYGERQSNFEVSMYDIEQDTFLDYSFLDIINDGYISYQHKDLKGMYDLADANGNWIETNSTKQYLYYSDNVKCYKDNMTEMYYIERNTDCDTFSDYISFHTWANGFYYEYPSGSGVCFLDKDGNFVKEILVESEDAYLTVSGDENLLLVSTGKHAYLFHADGSQTELCDELPYANAFLFPLNVSEGSKARYAFDYSFAGTNSYRYMTFYKLFDENGNVLAEDLNELFGTQTPGVYMVRQGFDYGLMDENGNWIFKENRFSSVTDDSSDWWR